MADSTLKKLETLQNEGKLGFLAEQVKFCSFAYSVMSGREGSQERILEDIRKKVIHVEFGRYGSSIERHMIKEKESNEKPRNFTLYLDIGGSGVIHTPTHFHWNGSWEGLDHEMKRDAKILRELGFKIDYQGHNQERDVSF
jgi:hypothetical protein